MKKCGLGMALMMVVICSLSAWIPLNLLLMAGPRKDPLTMPMSSHVLFSMNLSAKDIMDVNQAEVFLIIRNR